MTHYASNKTFPATALYQNNESDIFDATSQVMTSDWPMSSPNNPAIILVPSSTELIIHKSKDFNYFDSSKKSEIFNYTIKLQSRKYTIKDETEKQIATIMKESNIFRRRSDVVSPSFFLTCEPDVLNECSSKLPDETLDQNCTGILMFAKSESTCGCWIENPFERSLKRPLKSGWSKFTR